MRRLGITPNPEAWLVTVTERMNVYSGAADPAVAEVPENQWIVYHNTTIPEVRIWTNIAGVLMKSAAFV
jgi:hypothetical protein